MSDYFDRLLARHTPVARAAGTLPQPGADAGGGSTAPGGAADAVPRVRVRPRLPGPFERVEALRDRADGEDGLSPASPRAVVPRPSQTDERSGPRGLREIHTERHTVVRERPSATGPEEPQQTQSRSESAALRPAPSSRPLRPVANVPEQRTPRRVGRGSGPADTREQETGPAPALVVRSGEVVSRTAARPGSGDLTAERSARQQAAAARRGGPRTGERVVHVQIGRLEVSAAAPPGAGRGGAGEPGRQPAGRTEPTVSLETYLARGRNGERSN